MTTYFFITKRFFYAVFLSDLRFERMPLIYEYLNISTGYFVIIPNIIHWG